MKILTSKKQKKALACIDSVLQTIKVSSDLQTLKALDDLAELTYLIGGINELKKRECL